MLYFRKESRVRVSNRSGTFRWYRLRPIIKRGNQLHNPGETSDFDSIYESYSEKVLNLAFRITGNEDTARDLTQDIFIKVYQKLDTFEHRSNIYTWIYRVAVNHIYNFLKKERRRRWVGLLDKTVEDIIQDGNIEPSFPTVREKAADHKLEETERAEIVWRAVRSLPPKYAIPLTLYTYERLSYREIADALEISQSALEARIHRARKKLIKILEPWVDSI
jgi:RNA polymerase sigma-70 factor (ECF subfamily)